jgi:hypothetical protein
MKLYVHLYIKYRTETCIQFTDSKQASSEYKSGNCRLNEILREFKRFAW